MDSGTDESTCIRGYLAISSKNMDTIRYKAFPMRCKSWDCPHCAKIKGETYRVRMQPLFEKSSLFFYTFTFYHNKPELEAWEAVSTAWNRFRTAAQKKFRRFSYVRVLEHHHNSNYPHLHVIADVRFTDVWLAAELKAAGFGYQCKVKPVTSEHAGTYISKYLTKPWSSDVCRTIRKNLRLRLISFGGGACSSAIKSGNWCNVAMALDLGTAIECINTDVEWRNGQSAKITFEEIKFDSYEITVLIAEGATNADKAEKLLISNGL